MAHTRRGRKTKASDKEVPNTSVINQENVTSNEVVVSVASRDNDSSIMSGISQVSNPSISGTHSNMSGFNINRGGLRFAKDMVPEFDGKNLSVTMFAQHCRIAARCVSPDEMIFLITIIRTKITGSARQLIQDMGELTLEELLGVLERNYAPRANISQLVQILSTIKRFPNEQIREYGARVQDIINKITRQVMTKTPGERGIERCQEYRENAVGNFIRGLDEKTLMFIKNKEPPTLEEAIEQAMVVDLERKSYDTLHSSDLEKVESGYANDSSFRILNKKSRVAVVQSTDREQAGPSRGRPLSSVECFNCRQKGHYKRECPKLRVSGVKFVSNNKRKREDYCTYCEYENHTYDECRLRQKHERERNAKKTKAGHSKNLTKGGQKQTQLPPKHESGPTSVSSFESRQPQDE